MTLYLILREGGMKGEWLERVSVEARSARSAVAEYLKTDPGEGTFVATPARSFKPMKVEVETQTKLTFS